MTPDDDKIKALIVAARALAERYSTSDAYDCSQEIAAVCTAVEDLDDEKGSG